MSSPSVDLLYSFEEVDSEEPLTTLPAKLSSLLTSNDPPTKLQTEQILAVEHKFLSDLLNVKLQIDKCDSEEVLMDLRALQAKQHRFLETCKGMRSLARSLPNELLSRIFLASIPDDGVTVSQTSVHEAPMVVCQICSRWRSIALSTPQLWNRLTTTIGAAFPKPSYSRTLIKRTLDWFDRAKALPLSLRFTSHLAHYAKQRPEWFTEEAHIPDNLLCPLADRLRSLDLEFASKWTAFYLRSFPKFPKLESLILRRTEFKQDAEPKFSYQWKGKEPLITFQNATQLRRLAMYYPIFGNNIGSVLFPWKQLTHFIISEQISHSVLEDLLRSCVNLQQGVFDLAATPHSIPSRGVKTVQHHLMDLTITMDISFNPGILRNFELPVLCSLRLGPLIILDEHWCERHLLYPHLSSIRRLSFQAGYAWNETLTCNRIVELLQCAPNVERLDLCPGIFYPGLMEALTVDPLYISILPKLHSLSLDLGIVPSGQIIWEGAQSSHPRHFSASILWEMVKSRWLSRAVKCLEGPRVTLFKELHIYLAKTDETISDQIRDMLRECVDEGLVVDERSSNFFWHWSTRLKDEEISWPEGLSVLVSELKAD